MRRLLALVALFVAFATLPAGAAGEELVIRKIDTSAFPTITINAIFSGRQAPDLDDFAVRENGKIVTDFDVVPIERSSSSAGVVLVIDTSGSMKGAKLEAAKGAARQFVANKLPNDQIAVVAFSSEPRVVTNLTADAALLTSAIDSLQPAGETALWDAVNMAAGLLGERPELLPSMVVLSDGADTVSKAASDQAIGAAVSSRAIAFTVGLVVGGGEQDVAALQRLSADTGGTYLETNRAAELSALYGEIQRVLRNQYEVTWQSGVAPTAPIQVVLRAGPALANASAAANSVAGGSVAEPRVVEPAGETDPLAGGTAALLAALLAAAAAGLVGGVLYAATRSTDTSLDVRLRPYAGDRANEAADADEGSLVETAFVKRAVETTARLARERGVLQSLESKLDQADLRLRAQEALFFYVVAVALVTLGVAAAAGLTLGLAALVLVGLLPIVIVSQLAGRRKSKFNSQLPDTLQLLASSLRAGYSLQQALETVAQEVDEPMGRELRRVVLEARLGRSLEDALDDTAARMSSPDFDWVVLAVKIQREVGGNLAELLSTVAETMIGRERLRREVSALTAEGKLSAIIVGALPVAVAGALMVINPEYMQVLFSNTMGKAMILGAVVLAFGGFAWMTRIIKIDV